MAKAEREILTVAGREVSISNPRKVLFPAAGFTKMDHHMALYETPEKAIREEGGRYASVVADEIRRWIVETKPAQR